MAKVIAIGQPANAAEREAIAHLRDHLPDSFTLLHNFELRVGNQTFEIDLALLAPHAVYLVDVKSTAGEIHVHAGKWFPEGRPPFASPLAKLRQHARAAKGLLVGSPERPEMKRVYVDAVVLLTAPDALLNDPASVDSPAVVPLSRSAAFFQDPGRLPEQFQPAPDLRPLQRRILQTLQGGARPPANRDLYGDWRIEERLGGTAFYTEYRAYNRFAGPAAGRVSLRVYEADPYLPDTEREKQAKRIATAYTALSRLSPHPAVPSARSFFQDEVSGKYILVIEEALGRGLRLHLKKTSLVLTLDQKIRVVKDLLSALVHLHRHGVLHRAVNPGTIIIGPDGQMRLTDFDFARAGTDRSLSVGSEIYEKTEDDAYLAPEIFFEPHGAGPAADVYAAGVVFYELFTGEKAFASLKDAVEAECRFAEPPSQKTANLPSGFDGWLQSLCALQPADRPDARAALEQFESLFAPVAKAAPFKEEDAEPPLAIDYHNLPSGYALTHNYIVERRLGKPGSFGVAYKVIDTLGDIARVVKIIVKDRSSPVERLKQEYQHLLRIPPHPHVVKVIHAAYLPADNRPYIVFEYLDGVDISEMIENRQISLADAYKLVTQVAEGLRHLHEQGVTHCDIKPTNLLWTEQGVKIIDFNVSMSIANPAAQGGGSWKYFPPDLDRDAEQSVADRCDRDLFALGVTFYQAVTGRYPWGEAGVPVPGQAAPDPRTFPDCTELSGRLAEVMLKAIAPRRADRFRSAVELLVALKEIGNLRQTTGPIPRASSTLRWEDFGGDTPPRPNTNPFVAYLKTLYSQSDRTNVGTRGLDRLGGQLYVATALDTHLVPAVLEGQFRLVVISGNAGDGKTAFLQKLEKEARQCGEQVAPAPGGNGAIFKHRNRRFLSNYDGSQDEGDKINDAVLLEFLGPFQGAQDTVWPDNETRLIAINEGRLIDFLETHAARFPLLREIVSRGLRACKPELGVVLVNLNLRSIVASCPESAGTLFDRLLGRFSDPRFWEACAQCDLRTRCYAYHNTQTFWDTAGGSQVQTRLRMLYTLTVLREKLHITLRDLSSALAFMLTSGRDCDEIHDLYESGRGRDILNGFYFNSWMGGKTEQRDRLLKLLKEIDIGSISAARIDRTLDFRNPSELPGLMDFEARISTYDRQVLQSIYDVLPNDPSAQNPQERFERHREYVRALRRLHYFECRDGSWRSLLPYRSAERLLQLVGGQTPLQEYVPRLIRALNRGEGLFDTQRLKGKLALQVRRVENGTIRCYRVFPASGFSLQLKHEGKDSPFIESAPSGLVLGFDDGGEPGGVRVHADMSINLDIFEMLERLNHGYKPTVEEIQGFWMSLNVFKNILSSAPYQEILLSSSGHIFYSVAREQDGRLVMRVAESGGEYAAEKTR